MPNLPDIIYAMRNDLSAWMQQRGYGDAVYITEAQIDEVVGQAAIQLIPGSDTAVHPNSGVGLIRSQLEVVVWWRGLLDPMQRGTERISGETGIQPFVAQLREYLTQRKFTGMTIPCLFRSGGNVEAIPELDGWLILKDSYDFAFEMNWTVK